MTISLFFVILFLFIYKIGIFNETFLERIIRATIYLRKNDELTAPFVNPKYTIRGVPYNQKNNGMASTEHL